MTLRKAFDGEVYYWYEDDPTARREMSKVDPLRFINAKIYTQADLNQARKDAREAAFKAAIAAANSMFHNSEVNHSRWNTAVTEITKAIEAAANTEEGGGNANT